jgi:hypothetical protein
LFQQIKQPQQQLQQHAPVAAENALQEAIAVWQHAEQLMAENVLADRNKSLGGFASSFIKFINPFSFSFLIWTQLR